jgi:hypothetical protein
VPSSKPPIIASHARFVIGNEKVLSALTSENDTEHDEMGVGVIDRLGIGVDVGKGV